MNEKELPLDPEPVKVKKEDSEEKKIEEKKLKHSLDRYIIFSFTCIILYIIVSIILLIMTGMTMDTLTTCVFGVFGGEILACAMIKRFKLKEENGGGGKG